MKKNKLFLAVVLLVLCFAFTTGCSMNFGGNKHSRKDRDRNSRHERSVDEDDDEDDEDDEDDDDEDRGGVTNVTETSSDDYEFSPEHYISDDIDFPADMDDATRSCMTAAVDDLNWSPYSRAELISNLVDFEDFTLEQARTAVDTLEDMELVDWNEQAYLQARSFVETGAISRQGLRDMLCGNFGLGYTDDEADYAITRIESENRVDWNQEAVECATEYLAVESFTRDSMIFQLTSSYEGFTQAEAEYACDRVGLN